MTWESLQEAIAEAERFIAKAKAAEVRGVSRSIAGDEPAMWACKENGAVRRASLDLTRALAELRKSGV